MQLSVKSGKFLFVVLNLDWMEKCWRNQKRITHFWAWLCVSKDNWSVRQQNEPSSGSKPRWYIVEGRDVSSPAPLSLVFSCHRVSEFHLPSASNVIFSKKPKTNLSLSAFSLMFSHSNRKLTTISVGWISIIVFKTLIKLRAGLWAMEHVLSMEEFLTSNFMIRQNKTNT